NGQSAYHQWRFYKKQPLRFQYLLCFECLSSVIFG
ncbi:MAG: hypothetical protein ACI9L9_000082, partial [Marivirga sp.]